MADLLASIIVGIISLFIDIAKKPKEVTITNSDEEEKKWTNSVRDQWENS